MTPGRRDRIGVGARWAALGVGWGVALLVGCSDLGDPLGPNPPAEQPCAIEPASLDFGSVAVGQSGEETFRIRNLGASALSANLTLACADYAFISGGGPQTIGPGDTLAVTVRYTPAAAGPSSCTLATGLTCGQVSLAANGFVPATVSFAADVQPIFTDRCLGCHSGPVPTAGLDLGSGASHADLVGVVSAGYAPALRVAPGDTAASVLYHKVFGTGGYGARMPFGGPALPAVELDRIRTWIREGARDN